MTNSTYTPVPTAKLNVLSIVSIITAFVIPLAGVITGIIALRQIKTSGERGHGLALAGTILGAVFIILYLAIVVVTGIVSASAGSY